MNKKVLIVDDEEHLLRICRRVLDKIEITSDTAGTAEEGLEIFEEPGHCLILTDIELPGMNGIEFIRKIKKGHPTVKTIFMTGGNSLEYEHQAIQAGADAFIKKPFDINLLRETVKNLIS